MKGMLSMSPTVPPSSITCGRGAPNRRGEEERKREERKRGEER
eukprot:SAG11_NODE_10841_length_802_cov_1.284495_2_plen_42_part_01